MLSIIITYNYHFLFVHIPRPNKKKDRTYLPRHFFQRCTTWYPSGKFWRCQPWPSKKNMACWNTVGILKTTATFTTWSWQLNSKPLNIQMPGTCSAPSCDYQIWPCIFIDFFLKIPVYNTLNKWIQLFRINLLEKPDVQDTAAIKPPS